MSFKTTNRKFVGFHLVPANEERLNYLHDQLAMSSKAAVMNWAIKLAYDAVKENDKKYE